jgi:hypothetical protein
MSRSLRASPFALRSLGLAQAPSSATLRQRLDAQGSGWFALIDRINERLPSGKFDTKDRVCQMACVAMALLRLIASHSMAAAVGLDCVHIRPAAPSHLA